MQISQHSSCTSKQFHQSLLERISVPNTSSSVYIFITTKGFLSVRVTRCYYFSNGISGCRKNIYLFQGSQWLWTWISLLALVLNKRLHFLLLYHFHFKVELLDCQGDFFLRLWWSTAFGWWHSLFSGILLIYKGFSKSLNLPATLGLLGWACH